MWRLQEASTRYDGDGKSSRKGLRTAALAGESVQRPNPGCSDKLDAVDGLQIVGLNSRSSRPAFGKGPKQEIQGRLGDTVAAVV